jgi:hypothetical protein
VAVFSGLRVAGIREGDGIEVAVISGSAESTVQPNSSAALARTMKCAERRSAEKIRCMEPTSDKARQVRANDHSMECRKKWIVKGIVGIRIIQWFRFNACTFSKGPSGGIARSRPATKQSFR